MEGMEDKLGAILNNPDLMQKITAMAQSLSPTVSQPAAKEPPQAPGIGIDPAALQRIAGMMGSMGVDKHQRALLSALNPYLSRDRIQKLENAMRAAKMASLAANAVQRKSTSSSGR